MARAAIPAALAFLGLAFIVCALVIAGLPPLSGFVGKLAMLSALLDTSAAGSPAGATLFVLLLGSGLLAAIALMRVGMRHFWASPDRPAPRLRVVECVPIGLLLLGCIVLVPRVGARRISLCSALLMTIATVIFAWAPNVEILILARFVQGFASGSIWTASMSWVTDNAPAGHRGRESGIVMGLLSAGSIAGPGIGALAATAGSGATG